MSVDRVQKKPYGFVESLLHCPGGRLGMETAEALRFLFVPPAAIPPSIGGSIQVRDGAGWSSQGERTLSSGSR